ncbi:Facilitated trehalose transporter Tret1 [Dufourea novaeangliae]|uniref:Facilitated trehalose transporter Tret1 n=1 Tax=Dufourea novaeangliae TaxID=178035 RepID=A0A154PBB8_DUFNO|nr:Facilitated trehalose transporter Tret1 [Dufourea novaeangliae]
MRKLEQLTLGLCESAPVNSDRGPPPLPAARGARAGPPQAHRRGGHRRPVRVYVLVVADGDDPVDAPGAGAPDQAVREAHHRCTSVIGRAGPDGPGPASEGVLQPLPSPVAVKAPLSWWSTKRAPQSSDNDAGVACFTTTPAPAPGAPRSPGAVTILSIVVLFIIIVLFLLIPSPVASRDPVAWVLTNRSSRSSDDDTGAARSTTAPAPAPGAPSTPRAVTSFSLFLSIIIMLVENGVLPIVRQLTAFALRTQQSGARKAVPATEAETRGPHVEVRPDHPAHHYHTIVEIQFLSLYHFWNAEVGIYDSTHPDTEVNSGIVQGFSDRDVYGICQSLWPALPRASIKQRESVNVTSQHVVDRIDCFVTLLPFDNSARQENDGTATAYGSWRDFDSRGTEEHHSMLGYHSVNYAKVTEVENVCEDIENNNAQKEEKDITPGDNSVLTAYTSNSKGVLAQCLVSGAVLLLAAGSGMPIGYSAILLPQLAEDNGTMHADRELGSWIASVHSLATPVGSLLSGPLLDGIGRRGSLQLTAIPLCAGWIVMGMSRNIPSLLIGRIVAGFAVGLMAVPAQDRSDRGQYETEDAISPIPTDSALETAPDSRRAAADRIRVLSQGDRTGGKGPSLVSSTGFERRLVGRGGNVHPPDQDWRPGRFLPKKDPTMEEAGVRRPVRSCSNHVLLAETSDPELRGILTGGSLVSYCLGILLVYSLGASFTWDIVAFCGIVLPLIALTALSFIPESPVWLMKQEKPRKARKALLWLRGGNMDQVNTEMEILEARVKADLARKVTSMSWLEQIFTAISTILDPSILKPLTIINIFNILQLISGTYVVVFYAVELISDIGK